MKEETTHTEVNSDKFGLTPIWNKYKAQFPRTAKTLKILIFFGGALFLITAVNLTCNFTFSRELQHYPTLPFATLASALLFFLSLKFFWRERYAARLTTSIFLFFISIMFTQVNSELAANPTCDHDIIYLYKIFLYCLGLQAFTCISCYIFPNTPEQTPKPAHGTESSDSANNVMKSH